MIKRYNIVIKEVMTMKYYRDKELKEEIGRGKHKAICKTSDSDKESKFYIAGCVFYDENGNDITIMYAGTDYVCVVISVKNELLMRYGIKANETIWSWY